MERKHKLLMITPSDATAWENQVKKKNRLYLSNTTLDKIPEKTILKWLGKNNFYMIHGITGGIVKSF